MSSAVRKAAAAALLSIVVSLLVAGIVLPLMGAGLDARALVMCIVAPLVVAFPIGFHVHRQKELLRETHARLAEAHSQLAAAHARLAEKASRDDLTGLLSREAFLNYLRAACERQEDAALLMIDADDFKLINDSHGHLIGDEALKAIAGAISRVLRCSDSAGRIGGEEFAVLLRRSGAKAARQMAERIRSEVENVDLRLVDKKRVSLSVSIGGACFTGPAEVSHIIRNADRHLYEAKNSGRNRSVLAGGPAAEAA